MKAIVLLMLLAGSAHATDWSGMMDRLQGGGALHYELTGLRAFDDDAARMATSNPSDVVLAGARLGGFLGTGATVNYYIALDLLAGSTIRGGGFAYDVALYPIGMAVRFGRTSVFAIAGGIGASGAVRTVDDAMMLPVQMTLEAGRSWRVIARARFGYVLASDARQSAAPNVPFADEFEAMLGLRIGKHYAKHGFPSGNGYFLAGNYREQAGSRSVGATIGYSIDAALPRRFGKKRRRGY
jgi:hypothetical protein